MNSSDIVPSKKNEELLSKLKAFNDKYSLQYSIDFLLLKYSLTEANLKEWAESSASCMKVHVARLIMALNPNSVKINNSEPLIVKAK